LPKKSDLLGRILISLDSLISAITGVLTK
jgi:hypothetical protein